MFTILGILGAIIVGLVALLIITLILGALGLFVGVFGWLLEWAVWIVGAVLVIWAVKKIIDKNK